MTRRLVNGAGFTAEWHGPSPSVWQISASTAQVGPERAPISGQS
jgi:hypothetical protein